MIAVTVSSITLTLRSRPAWRPQAQEEKEQLMATAREHIEQEKQQAMLDVRTEVISLATEIAGKVVSEKLTGAEDQALIASTADKVLNK